MKRPQKCLGPVNPRAHRDLADGNLSDGAAAVKRLLWHETGTHEPTLDGLLLEGEALQLEPDRADLDRDGACFLEVEIVGGHIRQREFERFQLVHQPGWE